MCEKRAAKRREVRKQTTHLPVTLPPVPIGFLLALRLLGLDLLTPLLPPRGLGLLGVRSLGLAFIVHLGLLDGRGLDVRSLPLSCLRLLCPHFDILDIVTIEHKQRRDKRGRREAPNRRKRSK